METPHDTIDAQHEATDFTNIGLLPDTTNWHMDPVPTIDSTIQEMRNLRTISASSMFDMDAMTNISANEAVLMYGRAEQIRLNPNFQGSNHEAFQAAYDKLRANKDFFCNLDFGLRPAMPLPATFFDAINNTTIDANSVKHLLSTTFNRADTNFSSSINPISMEGTLYH